MPPEKIQGRIRVNPDSGSLGPCGTVEDMNTTPDPASEQQSPPGGTNGFFRWLHSLDITRSQNERWFAGVAGGIAQRAGIDPLIVRGIFVVLAILGGPGLLLYLAGWLLLPDRAGKIHAEELVRGRAEASVIVVVALIGVWLLGSIFVGINVPSIRWSIWGIPGVPLWFGSVLQWLFWIAVLVGVGILLHRIILHHGQKQQAPVGEGHAPTGEAPAGTSSSYTQPFTEATEKMHAWSAEYAAQHEERKLGAAHILISIALGLIAAGVAALWVHNSGVGGSNGVTVAALAAGTATLAGSMIIAGLRGKHSGTVGAFAFLGAVSLAITAVVPAGSTYHLIGNNTLNSPTPSSVSVVGDTNVDLALYDSDPLQTQVDISLLAGDVNIVLSAERPTRLTMDVAAGTIDAPDFGGETPGALVRKTITVNETAPGETLNVHVRLLAGTITVTQ